VIYARQSASDQQFAMIGRSGDCRLDAAAAARARDAPVDWCPLLSLVATDCDRMFAPPGHLHVPQEITTATSAPVRFRGSSLIGLLGLGFLGLSDG